MVLIAAWLCDDINLRADVQYYKKDNIKKDSLIIVMSDSIRDMNWKCVAYDSSQVKTERAYKKLEQTMGSAPLKHGRP